MAKTPFIPNSVVRSRTNHAKIFLVKKDGETLVNKETGVQLRRPPSQNFTLVSLSWAGA